MDGTCMQKVTNPVDFSSLCLVSSDGSLYRESCEQFCSGFCVTSLGIGIDFLKCCDYAFLEKMLMRQSLPYCLV